MSDTDEVRELEELYELSDEQPDVYQNADDGLRAALLKGLKSCDPDAVTVTRYFVTVEYVDANGAYGLLNMTPGGVPHWQLTAIRDQGDGLWDRHLDAVEQIQSPGEPESTDE